eukprot:1908203-Rhodomonas_salina.4
MDFVEKTPPPTEKLIRSPCSSPSWYGLLPPPDARFRSSCAREVSLAAVWKVEGEKRERSTVSVQRCDGLGADLFKLSSGSCTARACPARI